MQASHNDGSILERYRAEDYDLAATWCLRAVDVRPCTNCVQHAAALRNGCKDSDAGTTTDRGAVVALEAIAAGDVPGTGDWGELLQAHARRALGLPPLGGR